ncbi:metallophosphoesterase [Clavibacter michiganensis]|uniref:metallophosphoesterase n=1 Tax=Clavibacter michiganensis TaxID=28447 RepID=UPI0009A5E180|nr:metallophosphoesterase [Clavibacter michiganensis]MBF4637669.1 metallophosphoesterase [Clavibacter michiganensis subsp. michiganensis]MDO4124634.1 metallophosphoesterase [Clavibacter michiganensis]MDO4140378.1 metallophosphoesterase [Clavibacter michiganensis]MWJ05533.1 metallophosphatase [Clavibacter michiganensis subsp. michiganensis]MWJ87505.1 metallophosphatase [Clavibacter michiganensis subsp. michiganensis]
MHALPPGSLRLVHLSDTHLLRDGGLHQGVVDTGAALERVLVEADRVPEVRLLVGSGDLSEDGTAESYALLRERLVPWTSSRGAALVLTPGNHDVRSAFRLVLGDGHGAPGTDDGRDPAAVPPIDGVTIVDGWRIATLDTSVPGKGYGALREQQLDGLRELLATPAEHGTVLVLHHPPVAAPTTLHESLALQGPERLAEIVRGSDVRVILSGHYHHHIVGSLAGVPVLVAPGVANETDMAAEPGTERIVRGSGFLVVDVRPDGGVASVVVRAHAEDDGDEVALLDAGLVQRIIADSGAPAAP